MEEEKEMVEGCGGWPLGDDLRWPTTVEVAVEV